MGTETIRRLWALSISIQRSLLLTKTFLSQSQQNISLILNHSSSLTTSTQRRKLNRDLKEAKLVLTFGGDSAVQVTIQPSPFASSDTGFFLIWGSGFVVRLQFFVLFFLGFFFRPSFTDSLPLYLSSAVRVWDLVYGDQKGSLQNLFWVVRFWSPYLMFGFGKGILNLCFLFEFCLNSVLGIFLKF